MINAQNERREDKVAFILSCRASEETMNDEFYSFIVSEYKKVSDEEIDSEFTFYINN
jgi:hypothetical protein